MRWRAGRTPSSIEEACGNFFFPSYSFRFLFTFLEILDFILCILVRMYGYELVVSVNLMNGSI